MASWYGESLGNVSSLVIGGCNVVPTAQAKGYVFVSRKE